MNSDYLYRTSMTICGQIVRNQFLILHSMIGPTDVPYQLIFFNYSWFIVSIRLVLEKKNC